jgi:hypothetical protein
VSLQLVCAFGWCDGCKRISNSPDQGIEGSAGSFSQQRLDPGEELLNPIDIGTVGGKVTQFGAGGFDEVLHAGHFVAGRMTISP